MPATYWASRASVSMPNVITHQDGKYKCYFFTTPNAFPMAASSRTLPHRAHGWVLAGLLLSTERKPYRHCLDERTWESFVGCTVTLPDVPTVIVAWPRHTGDIHRCRHHLHCGRLRRHHRALHHHIHRYAGGPQTHPHVYLAGSGRHRHGGRHGEYRWLRTAQFHRDPSRRSRSGGKHRSEE